MEFQNYALFPHKNALRNLTFAPVREGTDAVGCRRGAHWPCWSA
jgi:ABC-type polar amino acid transport system ATPase subunit